MTMTPPKESAPPPSSDASAPPPPGDAAPPEAKHGPSMRSTVALVTAITGLVSAIAAFRHVPEEKTAKESYVVLQGAYAAQAAEVDGLKRDVLDLRASFEAYVRAKEGDGNVVATQPSPPSPPDTVPPVEVHVRPTPHSSVQPSSTTPPRVVIIPSARPPVTQRPLPDVRDVEAKALGKN